MKTVIVCTDNWEGTGFYLVDGNFSKEDGKELGETKLMDWNVAIQLGLDEDMLKDKSSALIGTPNKIPPELAFDFIRKGAKLACVRDDPFTKEYVADYLQAHHAPTKDMRDEGMKRLTGYLKKTRCH